MAGVPGVNEDSVVGGIPCFIHLIKNWLPKNKKKRENVIRVQMMILTYVVYSSFNMTRRPIAVVKGKIVEECDYQRMLYSNMREQKQDNSSWCDKKLFSATTEEFMGFLDSVYIAMYGFALFCSGVIADCYNPRMYLAIGCLLTGFFCAFLGMMDYMQIRSFKFMTVALILFGLFQSFGWPVVLSCVTHWYSGGKRGLFFGFWNTHNYVGSIVGIFLAGAWVDQQWMWSFFIPGFILAFMAVVVYSYMVADPGDLVVLEAERSLTRARKSTNAEVPQWVGSGHSIQISDAIKLPGVIEFSVCMFFSRMVSYIFLFWLPAYAKKQEGLSARQAAYYSVAYVVGGSLGGVGAGILVDIFRRSALVCVFFLLVSIPVLALSLISELGHNFKIDFPVFTLIGLFVEAPYIVTSTSVSADLGTHKMIKRNHRAIATIGGIIEGTGALGAAIGTYVCGVVIIKSGWMYMVFAMMVIQFVAVLCLSRQAVKDFRRKRKERKDVQDYWRAPHI